MIRAATKQDTYEVVAIDNQNGYKPWGEKSLYNSIHQDSAFVWDESGKIRAFSIFHTAVDEVELLNIVVQHGFEGQGIARKLLVYAFDLFFAKGITHAFLEVGVDNQRAIRFYESVGFTVLSTRKGYYVVDNKKVDARVMTMKLGLSK